MNSKFIILNIAVCFILGWHSLTFFAHAESQIISEFSTYDNKDLGFKIEYPKEFDVTETLNDTSFQIRNPDKEIIVGISDKIVFSSDSTKFFKSPDVPFSFSIRIYETEDTMKDVKRAFSDENGQLFFGKIVPLGKQEALAGTMKNQSDFHDGYNIGTIYEGKQYSIFFKYPKDQIEQYNPIIQYIIDSFEFTKQDKIQAHAPYRDNSVLNEGQIDWLRESHSSQGSGVVRVIDSDMNINPDGMDSFEIDVWSTADPAGILLLVIETDNDNGVFEGIVDFSSKPSAGSRLYVDEEDTAIARYNDYTLPYLHDTKDSLEILDATAIRQTFANPDEDQNPLITMENDSAVNQPLQTGKTLGDASGTFGWFVLAMSLFIVFAYIIMKIKKRNKK